MPTTDEPGPEQDGPRQEDPFEGLVLDEDFVRAAGVKEPSGRARMLAERWKHNPPPENVSWRPVTEIRRARWRRRLRALGPRARWARRAPSRYPRARWRPGLGSGLVLLLVPLAVLVVLASLGDGSTLPPKSSALPTVGAETASPSSAPPQVDPDLPTPEHPWAGSPAEAWPDGEAGIGMPEEVSATGVFGRDQVSRNLDAVKAYLVATNLDPQLLAGGSTQHVLDLMQPQDAELLAAALAHPDAEHDPTGWLSRFNPSWAVPVTDQVKVQGRISYESDGERGMRVHTDVTYVYALRPGPDAGKATGSPAPTAGGGPRTVAWVQDDRQNVTVEREIVRRVQDFRFYDPAKYQVKRGRPALDKGSNDFGNNRCELGSGYLEPDFDAVRATESVRPTGAPTLDPYDRTKPLDGDGGCRKISRS